MKSLSNYLYSQKGVALLTTIIIMSVLVTTVALISRDMLSELKVSNFLDNSQTAYYTAEAGVEYALAKVRYNKEFETASNLLEGTNAYNRYGLDEETTPPLTGTKLNIFPIPSQQGIISDTAVPTAAKRYFDLKVYYKATRIPSSTTCVSSSPSSSDCPLLLQDDILEFINPANRQYRFSWFAPTGLGLGNAMVLEFSGYDLVGNQLNIGSAGSKYMNKGTSGTPTSQGQSGSFLITPAGGQPARIRVRPWFTDSLGNSSGTGAVSLPDTNDTPYVRYAISLDGNVLDPANPLATNTTTIESIGSYGNTKRKIVAKVDRSSGNVVGIFDYVIYSATDLCKPTCP